MVATLCLVCFDPIDEENAVEYTLGKHEPWYLAFFCYDCIAVLQRSQFQKYCTDLAATTCAKEQRILLERGPPINLHDKNGFPESKGEELFMLRRQADRMEFSAKLKGSLEGEARFAFWEQQKQFIISDEEKELFSGDDSRSESTLSTQSTSPCHMHPLSESFS